MMPDVPLKAEDFLPETRNISNSEVTAYLSCKRLYDFSFIEGIEPIIQSVPLDRGSVGHSAFEYYIVARLNGSSHELSLKRGRDAFIEAIKAFPERIDVYMYVQQLWERYMEYHKGWPTWELLGTEQRLDLELTETLKIAIRYDLKIRDLATGKILLGDWKFAFDFWTDYDHRLNPQMPKYIAVMRLNDIKCDGGFVEEVRTRLITDPKKLRDVRNLWKRSWYWPSNVKLKSMMKQHVSTSLEIEKHRALPEDERIEYASIPVLNKFGPCKYCSFTSLCDSMNEGVGKEGLAVEIRTNFKQKTYGYNKGESVPGTIAPELSYEEIKEKL